MSWAANDPEGYDEVLANGVIARFIAALKSEGWTVADYESLETVTRIIQQQCPNAFAELVQWAIKEVGEAEADKLGM